MALDCPTALPTKCQCQITQNIPIFMRRFDFAVTCIYLGIYQSVMASQLWKKVERKTGTKIPIHLKTILVATGFDNEWSVLNINQDNLNTIEDFVNANKNIINGTKYENRETFHFDIGDKTVILSLPQHLNKIINEQLKVKGDKKQVNVDSLERNFDPATSKTELWCKISKYLSNKQTVFDLAETNILSCSISNKIIRCIVECPRCNAKITCVKQSTWRFWNLIKHIAKHSNQAERRAEIVEFSETGAAISSVVHRINNEDDLNRILR